MGSVLDKTAVIGPGSEPVMPISTGPTRAAGGAPSGVRFDSLLAESLSSVSFSKHALERIERRGIDLGGGTLERLDAGVARAQEKGARAAVVLVDGTAFVVAVRNRTVITAVDQEHMRQQVFTNIDSAVLA